MVSPTIQDGVQSDPDLSELGASRWGIAAELNERQLAERSELAIRDLLRPDAIRITAQPLVRLEDDAVLAYEIRWRMLRLDELPSLSEVWSAAEAAGLLSILDDALLRAELQVAAQLRPAAAILSMHPWRRRRPGLMAILESHVQVAGLSPEQVIWQLEGGEAVVAGVPPLELAEDLRGRHFQVAVFRYGVSNLRLPILARLRPEVLEMDRSFVAGLDLDQGLQAAVATLVGLSERMGSYLVAGGVSTDTERQALLELEVRYGQGPLLGDVFIAAGPDATPLSLPQARSVVEIADHGHPAPSSSSGASAPRRRSSSPRGGLDIAETLSRAARALQAEHDPAVILELTANYLVRIVPADGIAVYAADWDSGQFRPMLARSEVDPSYSEGVLGHNFALDKGLTGWAFELGIPQRVNDADAHPASIHIPSTVPQDESMLLIPMVAGDYRLGVLNLVRFHRDAFSAEDLTAASLLAHMAAAAWRNAQLYAEQVQHATTDSLTGLLNSRWLRTAARRELALADRSGKGLALLMIDLDNFKGVNDSSGHAAGDAVLRSVGRALLGVIRAEDAAVRYGGEEFVVLLPDAGKAGGRRIANAVRRELAAIQVPPGCSVPSISGSVGIALFPEHGRTLSQLLGAADSAMYEAKRNGGNRAILAG